MKRILCLILAAVLTLCLCSGCDLIQVLQYIMEYSQQEISPVPTQPPVVEKPSLTLEYALTDQMVSEFYQLMEQTEELAIEGEDMQAIDDLSDRLDEAYMDLIDQSQIAYLLYCTDQEDQQLSEQYLESSEIVSTLEGEYNEMAKRIYLSETPARDMLFEDWTQQDIDLMLLRNDRYTQLELRNTQIVTEFRALEDSSWEEDMIPLYNELVTNNNEMAQILGYENYYEFASEMIYQRDYDLEQIQTMRQLAQTHLAPLCMIYNAKFYDTLYGMDMDTQSYFISLLYDNYDTLEENYVNLYLEQLPQSAAQAMEGMFLDERVIFTDYPSAYEGAYTTFIEDAPFCFFGPGYSNSQTVIHELGHYYGSGNYDAWSVSIDLSETHSQANEWLFIRFLQDQLPEDIYNCMLEYQFMAAYCNILTCMMVDEFEYLVYTHENAGQLTLEQYDALMESVAENYGGIDYVEENITDIQYYWKLVALENPVYYLSYAVSGIAAADLFCVALEDVEQAQEIYCKLIEEGDGDQGFLWNIENAGLGGPFEESTYQKLTKIFTN